MHHTIRHRIARYLTDRPGSVVYRDEIEECTQLNSTQVMSSIRALQQDSPLGAEIQTVISGNAWRYTPIVVTTTTSSNDDDDTSVAQTVNGQLSTTIRRRRRADGSLPLTWQLRDYLLARPGVVVHCDELARHTGVSESQVKIGINNMRRGHTDIEPYVEVVASGSSWRYVPRDAGHTATSSDDGDDQRTAPPPSPPPPTVASAPRLFEEVGTTAGGAIIIRDDDGALYHATKM